MSIPSVVAYPVADLPPPPDAPQQKNDPSAPPAAPNNTTAGFFQGVQNEGGAREFLTQHKWPTALQDAFLANLAKTPIRFFVCDDSGSMSLSDGYKIVESGNQCSMSACSRWAELGDAMKFHVGLAQAGCIPTEFIMLNSSEPIRIGFDPMAPLSDSKKMLALFDNYPGGGTPLCRHIRHIAQEIATYTPELLARGQRACVIIATDGESSDGNVAEALRPLKDLPCWVVVRLCTNEDRIASYWNDIDEQLEVRIDVLDDLRSEGGEIQRRNAWLTYNNILHRMREFGVSLQEFDSLDERKLSFEMMRKVCMVIYGKEEIERLPLPELDLRGFARGLSGLNAAHAHFTVWSPMSKRLVPWVDPARLESLYSPGGGCCTIS